MKKNGFTFIEILGVLTLLALVSVIVLISVNKSLTTSKQTVSQVQIENIKSAAIMWRTDHIELILDTGYYPVKLGELQDEGYIKEVIDSETNEPYDRDIILGVSMNDVIIEKKALKTVFEKKGNSVFDGSNCIITDVYLFNNDNVNKDFEISFRIPNYDASLQVRQATLLSAMDESGSPYPGILYRRETETEYLQFVSNTTSSSASNTRVTYTENQKISMLRYHKKLFYKINDEPYVFLKDYTDFNLTFSVPVTFGAGLNASGEPFRNIVGTLSDITIMMED